MPGQSSLARKRADNKSLLNGQISSNSELCYHGNDCRVEECCYCLPGHFVIFPFVISLSSQLNCNTKAIIGNKSPRKCLLFYLKYVIQCFIFTNYVFLTSPENIFWKFLVRASKFSFLLSKNPYNDNNKNPPKVH